MRELVYYAAVTLDGFIAGPAGQFDAFPATGDHMAAINERFADTVPTEYAEMLGLHQDRSMFDTVLMGWNTYGVGGASPYRHLRQIVFSRTRTASGENLEVTGEDPLEVVRRLKGQRGASIWLCGGGRLAGALAPEIDRLVLKRYPILFGDGIPLIVSASYDPAAFAHVSTRAFESGMVLSEYARRR